MRERKRQQFVQVSHFPLSIHPPPFLFPFSTFLHCCFVYVSICISVSAFACDCICVWVYVLCTHVHSCTLDRLSLCVCVCVCACLSVYVCVAVFRGTLQPQSHPLHSTHSTTMQNVCISTNATTLPNTQTTTTTATPRTSTHIPSPFQTRVPYS